MGPLLREIISTSTPAEVSALRGDASSDSSKPSVARIATRLPFIDLAIDTSKNAFMVDDERGCPRRAKQKPCPLLRGLTSSRKSINDARIAKSVAVFTKYTLLSQRSFYASHRARSR